ncbi:hypothetical protein [Haloferax chudinovii]|uniref:DUF975 family protein n=1 Tax=Haloferax chudinovii TaxID=1109010 RepID=A0ABD5XHP6_9EURY
MKYADTVVRAARLLVRNPFAVLLVSVATTLSLVPLVSGVALGGVVGGLVGLWTSTMLLGFVAVGGSRLFVIVVEREVSLGTGYFWKGIRAGKTVAPVVGFGTFVVAFGVLLLASNPLDGIAGMSVAMLGVYLLLTWYVLVMYSLTLWASSDQPVEVRDAFVGGGRLILERPVSAGWLLVQTIGWTLLSIPLFIAPVLLLPGFVQLVGTAIITRAMDE